MIKRKGRIFRYREGSWRLTWRKDELNPLCRKLSNGNRKRKICEKFRMEIGACTKTGIRAETERKRSGLKGTGT